MSLLEQEQLIEHLTREAYVGRMSMRYIHDMRNTLSQMAGYLSHLRQEIRSDSAVTTTLSAAIREADQMHQDLKRFMDHAWLALSPRGNEAAETIGRCVTRAVAALSRQADTLRIQLASKVMDNAVDVQVPVDLRFILTILLSNALEALNEVHHRKRCVFVRARLETTNVMLAVSDNGVGIAPEYLDTIFTPGFTTKSRSFGTDLYVAKRLIERYDGCIQAQSRWGAYTKFTITLPAGSEGTDEENTLGR